MKIESKSPRSPVMASVHEAVSDLHEIGLVDRETMRSFDAACLTAIEPVSPQDVRRIREKAKMSQAVFARVLNVTTSLVSKWERGEKKPSGPSQKLLVLADKRGIDAIM